MGWPGRLDSKRLELVMRMTGEVRTRFHALRGSEGANAATELQIVDNAHAELSDSELNADEQLAARIRFAQFKIGILGIHDLDVTSATEEMLELLNSEVAGPVSAFMQARVGMVMLADLSVNSGRHFPRDKFQRFLDTVTAATNQADDEFWFFATLQAYIQGWDDVLEQAIKHVGSRWEEVSGQYLGKRTRLMLHLLKGTATEADCGEALQAVNRPLFYSEFTIHMLLDCEKAGVMTPMNRQIWKEREAEFSRFLPEPPTPRAR